MKKIRGTLVFAPPKRGMLRDVPLDPEVSVTLRDHMTRFPPVDVTLPWLTPTGPKVTRRLVLTSSIGAAIRSQVSNDQAWKPALASAGIIPTEKGERYAAAREHGMHALRHFYASVLLDAGENIKALSLYLGHSDPGFTLRIYTHLMPSSETRTRKAISAMYRAAGHIHDGLETAQGCLRRPLIGGKAAGEGPLRPFVCPHSTTPYALGGGDAKPQKVIHDRRAAGRMPLT